MHTSPLSKEFYNSISDVLMGKTTTKLVLPASLVDSANKARKELKQSFLSEGFVSLEARRDILRKNLKEGADTCGCTLTTQMVSRFSEMAGEVVAEEVISEEVVAETEEVAEQAIDEAKASPQEDEFLTDLTKAQIAAISPLMKSKDWNKLKAYLVSQKMVDKNFEDIKGYKMDRDVLSVLQRSFKDYHEQVETAETDAVTEANHIIEVTGALTDFVKELNEDEVRILKNLLNNH